MTKTYNLTGVAATLLGFSLSLAGHAAQAAPGISVEASISKTAFTVIDLTPNDGYSAGYTLTPSSAILQSNIITPDVSLEKKLSLAAGVVEPIAATIAHGASTSTSTATQGGEIGGRIQVLDAGTKAYGYVLQSVNLQIAAHTQLVFTGYSTLSISNASQDSAHTFAGDASTLLFFTSGGPLEGHSISRGFGDQDNSFVSARPFSLTVDNNSDRVMSTVLMTQMFTHAVYRAPSPVPEPATYAMFSLGALMVGACARRQRRRAQA
ncbi:PEP-CTERM sorting domain-containing protein [Massilia sp. P8910]|uniref:PEP-CTERM sorting domain-containing protein n=1 Tax=Massilia antarctica TaxID=2765360 RepID=UPI001E3B34FE|nr:PEP-CTERM sorting domain-containing protein [Massilia antarctica]MCE3607127.1 PEP-CTERM sorting domain-containing protein [Massilia antarctica]